MYKANEKNKIQHCIFQNSELLSNEKSSKKSSGSNEITALFSQTKNIVKNGVKKPMVIFYIKNITIEELKQNPEKFNAKTMEASLHIKNYISDVKPKDGAGNIEYRLLKLITSEYIFNAGSTAHSHLIPTSDKFNFINPDVFMESIVAKLNMPLTGEIRPGMPPIKSTTELKILNKRIYQANAEKRRNQHTNKNHIAHKELQKGYQAKSPEKIKQFNEERDAQSKQREIEYFKNLQKKKAILAQAALSSPSPSGIISEKSSAYVADASVTKNSTGFKTNSTTPKSPANFFAPQKNKPLPAIPTSKNKPLPPLPTSRNISRSTGPSSLPINQTTLSTPLATNITKNSKDEAPS